MPTPLEAEISNMLRRQGDTVLVAEELISRWRRNILSEAEQIDCAQFLVSAGLYPLFFAEILRLMETGSHLPWAQFAEALGRSHVKPDEYEMQALFDAADFQNGLADLVRSRQLDLFSSLFSAKRHELMASRDLEIGERRQALKDKLQFVRAQRMFEQEALVIQEIQALFPDEDEIKKDLEAFQLRWAREVVSNASAGSSAPGGATDLTTDLQWRFERLTPEQSTAKALIVERALELAEEKPELAHDLAITLHLMDFNAEALLVLTYTEDSFAIDWLRLELMIRARQFATALDETSRLEIQYADEPDAAFAAVYARARALHGLGQSAMAIELLRSLVRIRPQYKSAQSLLMDWSGGDA